MEKRNIATPEMDKLMGEWVAALNGKGNEDISSQPIEKRTYSVDDLQQILDLSRSTVYLLIKRNLFRSIKIGKQIRIPKKSFDEWLDQS